MTGHISPEDVGQTFEEWFRENCSEYVESLTEKQAEQVTDIARRAWEAGQTEAHREQESLARLHEYDRSVFGGGD